jgi:DNA-cytosine methyltransferase
MCQNLRAESLICKGATEVLEKSAGGYTKKLPAPTTAYVIDFFCGCGGASAGFVQTRQSHFAFEVLAGLDINEDALATYRQNTGVLGIRADIRKLAARPESLKQLIPGWDPTAMRPLVFVGCPPCQGFSALRKGDERDDARNDLSLAFAKIVKHFRPDLVVMENVPEILRGRFSHHFSAAKTIMERDGYKFASAVVDLSLFGVPQRRRRALVLGALGNAPKLPSPIFKPSEVRTVRQAIAHLRPLEAGQVDPEDPAHRAPAHTERLIRMFKKIPPDGGDRRALADADKLAAHKKLDSGDTPGFTDVYGRLRWDSPSVTITAKSRSPSSGRFLHPEQHRNITVREAALLQGFPQSYSFTGAPTQLYRQIGEAVPPMFARAVAWAVLDYLRPVPEVPTPKLSKRHFRPSDGGLVSVDCFCGAGGLGLGFLAAGIDAAFAFDTDQAAAATYSRNLGLKAHTLDVRAGETEQMIEEAVASRSYCLIGGPPCQGFSHQRRGDPADPRNELVLRFAELAIKARHRPAAIVLENVTDLDLPRGRHILAAYTKLLASAGYACFRHDLNSAEFGVPQLRNRIVVVGLPREFAAFYQPPTPLTPHRWLTVGEALTDLPEPGFSLGTEFVANHIAAAEGEQNRRRIAFVDMGQGRKSIPTDLQLPCHIKSYRGHRDVYGRLDWFSQARTLTAGFDSFTRGEYGHPFRHRSITAREAARIQGFPDWFEFVGNRAEVRHQIGNAVPPPLAFAVGQGLLAVLKRAGVMQWAA